MDSPNARFGIMASGKSYEDQAGAARIRGHAGSRRQDRIELYKIGMPWPLEPQGGA